MVRLTEPFSPTVLKESRKLHHGDFHDLVQSGFDITVPRILLIDEIRKKAIKTSNLVSLLFVDKIPPKTDWYRTSDSRFIRISNKLFTSIIFTGQTSENLDWIQCVVCYAEVTPLFTTGTRIFLEPPPCIETRKSYDPQKDAESINVLVCWMHHQDVYLFLSNGAGYPPAEP